MRKPETIYLDYNATTPLDSEVIRAMRPYLEQHFGNPSSQHCFGLETKFAIEIARKQISTLLNCNPDEVVFTSGGTESNNYAIKGIAFEKHSQGNHIITSQIEHPAVLEVCRFLETKGFEITYLPVDHYGCINLSQLENAIRPTTILITIMHANNEVGTIQPIREISKLASEKGICFHTDAAQTVGKIETDVQHLGVDLLTIAGHKLYAPKGIGVLFIRNGVKLEKLMHGANHENDLRAGTENVLEIVGLGKAAEVAFRDMNENHEHLKLRRDELQRLLLKAIPDSVVNGHPEFRLPNTLSISFPNIQANILLGSIDKIAASAGAACHTHSISVSSVLEAMQIPVEIAMGTIRLSTGRETSLQDVRDAANMIISAVEIRRE
ncbi:MAG: cysteine desulfurase [Bacteroidales bacterium]|nr:cysteine desulfurase [Bacteroidales bacterium]